MKAVGFPYGLEIGNPCFSTLRLVVDDVPRSGGTGGNWRGRGWCPRASRMKPISFKGVALSHGPLTKKKMTYGLYVARGLK